MPNKQPSSSTRIRWSKSSITAQQTRNAERKERERQQRQLAKRLERPAKQKPAHHRKRAFVPLPSMRSPHAPGIVYIARMHGRYKIGMSSRVEQRIPEVARELRAQSYHIVRLIETDDRLALEQALHRQFAAKRIEGEWFDLDSDDLAEIQLL